MSEEETPETPRVCLKSCRGAAETPLNKNKMLRGPPAPQPLALVAPTDPHSGEPAGWRVQVGEPAGPCGAWQGSRRVRTPASRPVHAEHGFAMAHGKVRQGSRTYGAL